MHNRFWLGLGVLYDFVGCRLSEIKCFIVPNEVFSVISVAQPVQCLQLHFTKDACIVSFFLVTASWHGDSGLQ